MDSLSKSERSLRMSKVRSRGNRSTEVQVRMALVRAGVKGWTLHPRDVVGVPDFWFATKRLAIFVDGCFWHGCGICLRMPKQNRKYWEAKIARNIERGREVQRTLKRDNIAVVKVWEHEVRRSGRLAKVVAKVERILERAPNS